LNIGNHIFNVLFNYGEAIWNVVKILIDLNKTSWILIKLGNIYFTKINIFNG